MGSGSVPTMQRTETVLLLAAAGFTAAILWDGQLWDWLISKNKSREKEKLKMEPGKEPAQSVQQPLIRPNGKSQQQAKKKPLIRPKIPISNMYCVEIAQQEVKKPTQVPVEQVRKEVKEEVKKESIEVEDVNEDEEEEEGEATPSCLHGSLPFRNYPQDEEGMKRAEAIKELLLALKSTMASGVPFSAVVLNFVKEPAIGEIVDRHLVSYTLAFATAKLQEEDVSMAKLLISIALALKAAIGRIPDFVKVLEGAQRGEPVVPVPTWYLQWNSDMVNLSSERDVVLFLSKSIPCDCLKEQTQRALGIVDTKTCHHCCKADVANKLMQCKGCKLVRYCSRDCQVKAWKEHKIFCQSLSHQEVQEETKGISLEETQTL
jgi:hypothetical protein